MQFDAFGVATFPRYVSVGGRAVIQFFFSFPPPSFVFDMILGLTSRSGKYHRGRAVHFFPPLPLTSDKA